VISVRPARANTESVPPNFFNDPDVHFMRNALAHVGPSQRPMVAAVIRTAFPQETAEAAHTEWRAIANRLRERFRKLAELMDEAEDDVLAHMAFPKHHCASYMARSSGAPTWSPSSPTRMRSSAWTL
jgi:hypothetical protein